jgi:hypothetical protein
MDLCSADVPAPLAHRHVRPRFHILAFELLDEIAKTVVSIRLPVPVTVLPPYFPTQFFQGVHAMVMLWTQEDFDLFKSFPDLSAAHACTIREPHSNCRAPKKLTTRTILPSWFGYLCYFL